MIASGETSPADDVRGFDWRSTNACPRSAIALTSPVRPRLRARERTAAALSASSAAASGIAHPASSPKPVLEPVLEHVGDAHQVDIDPAGTIAVDVEIAAERLARETPSSPASSSASRIAASRACFAIVDRPLRHDPTLAPGCRHQGHLDALLADSVGNHRRLRCTRAIHPSCRECRTVLSPNQRFDALPGAAARLPILGPPPTPAAANPPAGPLAAPRRRAASAAEAPRARLRSRFDRGRFGPFRSRALPAPASATHS